MEIIQEVTYQKYHDIEIRPFDLNDDDLDRLTFVLNSAYKQLADMGFRYLASHQDASVTHERIKNALCLIGIQNNNIIATITYYRPGLKRNCPWYQREDVSVVGQFGVMPNLQSQGIGTKLLNIAEKIAANEGVKELALDTAEGASHLRNFYSKHSYRFIEYTNWDVTNYRSVIMSKRLKG